MNGPDRLDDRPVPAEARNRRKPPKACAGSR
jgi:hypothetical protein